MRTHIMEFFKTTVSYSFSKCAVHCVQLNITHQVDGSDDSTEDSQSLLSPLDFTPRPTAAHTTIHYIVAYAKVKAVRVSRHR